MGRKDAGSGVLIAVVGILVLAIIALLGGTYWNNVRQEAVAHIKDFASCKADSGSRIQESYPEVCVTSDGRNFTGPTEAIVTPTLANKTYCTSGERLCFKYPDTWTVSKRERQDAVKGSNGDSLSVTSPDSKLTLRLESGVGGIGGTCDPSARVTLSVLESTEIPKMKGFKRADYAYSLNTLRVARVVAPKEGKYLSYLYVASDSQYTNVSVLKACGIYFSNFTKGRYAVLGPEATYGKDHGMFTFGYVSDSDGVPAYDTLKEAKAVYSSQSYQEAAAILASLYYKK